MTEKEDNAMMWGYGWNGLGFLWMILIGIFWLAALGVAIWALLRWTGNRGGGRTTPYMGNRSQTPLDILRERYARGEVDTATFDQMRERLEEGGSNTVFSTPQNPNEPNAPPR